MGRQNRRKYDADFKRNAVLLNRRPDKAAQEVADDLGIYKDLIFINGASNMISMESWLFLVKDYCISLKFLKFLNIYGLNAAFFSNHISL